MKEHRFLMFVFDIKCLVVVYIDIVPNEKKHKFCINQNMTSAIQPFFFLISFF